MWLAKVAVLFSLLIISITSFAGLPWPECQALLQTGKLRFDRYTTMPAGRFKGRPLSANTPSWALTVLDKRKSQIIPEPVPSGYAAVANFVGLAGPSLALIPNVAPEAVSILREDEVDGTWHIILRLRFAQQHKIKFWPQSFEGILSDPQETRDIVIDFGSHRLEGHERKSYSALRGLFGHYALQARMGTTYFKVRYIRKDNRKVVEFPIFLNEADRRELLERFLARTLEINNGEMYHSLTKNCATEVRALLSEMNLIDCKNLPLSRRLRGQATSWSPSGLLWLLNHSDFPFSEKLQQVIEIDDADQV